MPPKVTAISGEIFTRHDIGPHDESAERIRTAQTGLPHGIPLDPPVPASAKDLERVHTRRHIRMIQNLASYSGRHFIDQNTFVTPESFDVACHAAGATIEAASRGLQGQYCFALVRPPGHHAEPDRAMGFCLFNNAAVAAHKALDSVDRIAIVDWDLHHGNGTQKIFYDSDRVFYMSIHQGNLFPRTGWIDEIGTGRGKGFNLNIPIRPGCSLADYSHAFSEIFLPEMDQFKPDLILVSAGQDPLADDPKSQMHLIPPDFGVLTGMLIEGRRIPLALVLEGGYGPSHGEAIRHIFLALQGEDYPLAIGIPKSSTSDIIKSLKKIIQ